MRAISARLGLRSRRIGARRPILRAGLQGALCMLLATVACGDATSTTRPDPTAPGTDPASPVMAASSPSRMETPTAVVPDEPAPLGPRAKVVLVELGKPFPPDLIDEVQRMLERELQVEVTRHARIPLPDAAYYEPRRRYRADRLLDHLLTLIPDEPETTRVLGLTNVDISTTKGEHYDWGIFGLGLVPGQAAVISKHRLQRGVGKDRAKLRRRVAITALHEIGHTLGLPHCPEPLCPMQDAEGSIRNTDTTTGHLGPDCRAQVEANFPRRPVAAD